MYIRKKKYLGKSENTFLFKENKIQRNIIEIKKMKKVKTWSATRDGFTKVKGGKKYERNKDYFIIKI